MASTTCNFKYVGYMCRMYDMGTITAYHPAVPR